MQPIDSKRLTIEANKALPNYSILPTGYATESKGDDLATYISIGNVSTIKEFKKIIESVTTRLSNSQYLQDNFMVIYKTDAIGNPAIDRGVYVYAWNNPDEYQNALKAKLTLEMESLLDVKKLVVTKYEAMQVTLEAMQANKPNTTKPLTLS